MLHITNGESTVASLRESGLPGDFLAWNDPLHDGPVPATANLAELSEIRAQALSGFGWGSYAEIRAAFAERDARLAGFREHDEVVLWFEHDLYDELQVLQLLDWFSGQAVDGVALRMIRIDSHPEVIPFHGLGQLTGSQLAALFPGRETVSVSQLQEGSRRWRLFTSPSHAAVDFLPRMMEEYPGPDGLSRTERQLLWAARAGAETREEYYLASRKYEDCPWGDSSVYLRLDGLAEGPSPALLRDSDRYLLSEFGNAVLSGEAQWGGRGRWIGGVNLQFPAG